MLMCLVSSGMPKIRQESALRCGILKSKDVHNKACLDTYLVGELDHVVGYFITASALFGMYCTYLCA